MAIAGIVRFGEPPRRVEHELQLLAAALAPYGGHRCRTWCDATIGIVQLAGHTVPGDTAERPSTLTAGPHVLVADARVDNRAEVAGSLGLSPAEERSMLDDELVRRAFEQWGVELTRHLIGAFAIAAWDPGNRMLHCIRDHAGQRPLFYHRGNGLFAFASMPSALLALDELDCSVDEAKMAEMLLGCHARTDATPFRGVRRIPGGTRVEAGEGVAHVVPYWDVADSPTISLSSDDEYAREARSLLLASTGDHLRANQPIGVSLSGGLDSSAVACAAATLLREQQRRITAFHRMPPGDFGRLAPKSKLLHESEFVEAIAGRYDNVDVALVDKGAESPLQGLAERTRYCQRPVLRVANHDWFHPMWSDAAARGIGVLLVGGAGDLTMSWGGRGELAELARRGRMRSLMQMVSARATWLETTDLRVLRTHVISPLLAELRFRASAPFVPRRDLQYAVAQSPINPALVDELDMAERLLELGWDMSAPRLLQQRKLRLRQATSYHDAVGEIHAGLGAMYGFEYRDPFRDKRVLEFCFGIPPLQYLSGGADRSLLRRAMAGMVPNMILERRRKGAQAVDWAERIVAAHDELRAEIDAISRSPLASHILDVPRMGSILEGDRLSRWVERRSGATEPESRAVYGSLMRDYSGVLLTGIAAGMFLRWLEDGCRPPGTG